MPDAYVIQIGGRTAGIVARDGRDRSFNFFAASQMFNAMEGQRFEDPAAAEKTARYLAKHGSLPGKPEVAPVAAGASETASAHKIDAGPSRREPFGSDAFAPEPVALKSFASEPCASEPFSPAPWHRRARVV